MPRRGVIVLSALFLVINVLGSAYAKEGSKTGPEGVPASATPPTKAKAASAPSVDMADPVLTPSEGGSDAADGPIGETTDTNPDVVPLGPTSSSSSSSVAAGPGVAAAPKSGAGALKVPVVTGAASVLGGFFMFMFSF